MCFRSLRHRNLAVVVVLFCIIMLLVPSYVYRDRYINHLMKDDGSEPREHQEPSSEIEEHPKITSTSTIIPEAQARTTDSAQPPAKTNHIALHNSFPSLESRLHTGKSLVFQPDGVTPRFEDEVLDSVGNRTFLLLKTGSETMWSRLPVHLQTTMKRFPHNAIYSDIAAPVMGYEVCDALMHLPSSALNSPGLFGYRVRRQDVYEHWGWGPRKLKIEGEGSGWETDKYKNVPAFADAWRKAGDSEWFLMLDDDSYMLTYTLAELVRDKDPDESWYFGKGVGWNPMFAHGGSGIVLSRGAMRTIFDDPTNYTRHIEVLEASTEYAKDDCCGDSVLAKIYSKYTGLPAERDLERTETRTLEHGVFQGNTLKDTRINYDSWCSAIGAFHHLDPWEIDELFVWERVVAERKLASNEPHSPVTYSEFYRDFILPYVAHELPSWHFPESASEYEGITYEPGDGQIVMDGDRTLEPASNVDDCRRTCELDGGCLSWNWLENVRCQLVRFELGRGEGLNPWHMDWEPEMSKAAAGFMNERIRAVRVEASCDPLTRDDYGEYNDNATTSEGWYWRLLNEERGPTSEWGIHPLEEVLIART